MGLIEKILFHFPNGSRQSVYDTEEMTALELAGRTAQKTNEVIDKVNGVWGEIAKKENSDDITNNRKLSPDGNFTGKLSGRHVHTVLGMVDVNRNQIKYISNQFSDGQTGLVIDGGFFEDDGIKKNYNGGIF